jgi:UDP-N-acetylmuramate dehydrogenase
MDLATLFTTNGLSIREHASLGAMTTYRVGGTARLIVECATVAEVEKALALCSDCSMPVLVIGNGSNLLVADGELNCVAIHLSGELATASWEDREGQVIVRAGAGMDLPVLSRRLTADGVVGFEWAVGVPGTVGGAVVMNAGGHGSDIAASLVRAFIVSDESRWWSKEELAFGYRSSAIKSGVVIEAEFLLSRGDSEVSALELKEIVRWRREHQPGGHNAGSVFQNPTGEHAGQLIEQVGLKGYRRGSAQVSDKHANFIIADDDGSAADVMALILEVIGKVEQETGVLLQSEHKFYGFEK